MPSTEPADAGAALCNPGMGWVLHYYDNSLDRYGSRLDAADTLDDFPGLGVIYFRLAWAYLEPEEGCFNWSVVDAPAQRWLAKGKQIAFRFTCCESGLRYATPEWVKEAGAKGSYFRRGDVVSADEPGACWEPDYDDPVFLEKLGGFLAAAAARYDGSPEVAFVDVGSQGVWGEGHTFWSTGIPYGEQTARRHIDLHCRHFRQTLLVLNDDLPSGPPRAPSQGSQEDGEKGIVLYARERGLTLRDDSILVQGEGKEYFSVWMAPCFYEERPVILECEHYGPSRDRGCWRDGLMYLQAVEDYRASYASIHWWPREFLAENEELVRRINRRLGYRLQLIVASWPDRVRAGAPLRVRCRWRNAGVAPCLPGGRPAVTLKNAAGGIVAVLVDEAFDVRSLPVGPPGQAGTVDRECEQALPADLAPGTYGVYVSVGTPTGTPRIALPMEEGDSEGRYRLGEVNVAQG
ncbi:MAG: hypothetical protein AMK73_06290 [Planctomycetes bacterium SM23_32]|nr:MAG: hypothetical protein AMK73_06290 [Planctomycetes bacterium SM23_32]